MQNIELRSEKIRKAIGKKPSFFLRWGTVIITIVLAAGVLGVAFFLTNLLFLAQI